MRLKISILFEILLQHILNVNSNIRVINKGDGIMILEKNDRIALKSTIYLTDAKLSIFLYKKIKKSKQL